MLAILDYKAGNLRSVELAVKHLGAECTVTNDPAVVEKAERIIFPGVGAAKHCMENLNNLGLADALKNAIGTGKPVLAICIGIQLLFEKSEEDGGVPCLGILKGSVDKFEFDTHVKVPHMGWNEVNFIKSHPVFEKIENMNEFYFVHSYYPNPTEDNIKIAETEYEGKVFTSAVGKDNLIATQFHPEKSGKAGLKLIENFINWDGKL
jgi:glutamine amidotransferase